MKLPEGESNIETAGLTNDKFKLIVKAGLSSQILHTVSRVASLVAQGYYTIGAKMTILNNKKLTNE